ATQAWSLSIEPVGEGPPYADFAFALAESDPLRRPAAGTSVCLRLARPIAPVALAQEIAAVAGLVDPVHGRFFVNGEPVNTARPRLRRVARSPIGGPLGDLDLLVGRGDGIAPRLTL